jgi:hypothetical protein
MKIFLFSAFLCVSAPLRQIIGVTFAVRNGTFLVEGLQDKGVDRDKWRR